MWVAKIKLKDKNCIWATRCKKFNIYNYQYPLGLYKIKNGVATMLYHIFDGDEKNIKKYIKDVKKDKKVKRLEVQKNSMMSLAVEKRPIRKLKVFEALYNPKLIYIKPGINYPDGSEIWEITSFDREDLIKLFNTCKEEYFGELLFLKQIKTPKLFIPQLMPELTDKQEEAFKLAYEEGYYQFPRKTNLIKLSRFMKISRPTYEEHLRKAENRLLKFIYS